MAEPGTHTLKAHGAIDVDVDVGLMWRLERVTQLYTGLSSTRSRSTRMLEITGGRSVINIRCRHPAPSSIGSSYRGCSVRQLRLGGES